MTEVSKAIEWMEKTAKDNKHGYDQNNRWGEKGDYDCSAAVITAWDKAGVPVKKNGATYTGNLKKAFLASGFEDVTKSVNLAKGTGLKRGDVLLAEGHHVAMYRGDGMEVEASINEKGKATGGKPGDQTGREFLIRKYRNYPWTDVLRYGHIIPQKETPKKTTEKKNQNAERKPFNMKITAKSGLNIRKGAGFSNEKVIALPYGTMVESYGYTYKVGGETWTDVRYKGHSGYSVAKWLKKV